ncbi:hypothetical protein C8R31_105164 [Nitrosospira sp. Nsp2]|nr:hypothetical protein C8R31_105164 [Nitrosospira sp. Nsp2]
MPPARQVDLLGHNWNLLLRMRLTQRIHLLNYPCSPLALWTLDSDYSSVLMHCIGFDYLLNNDEGT